MFKLHEKKGKPVHWVQVMNDILPELGLGPTAHSILSNDQQGASLDPKQLFI